jgi:flagellar biosynthetic protein FlhB
MSAEEDEAEKSHDATPQKLQKAREKGEVARSADLSVAASYAGMLLALVSVGAFSIDKLGTMMVVLIDQADTLSRLMFEGPAAAPMGGILIETALAVAPLFAVPFVAIILSVLVQQAFVFAPTKLVPKISRISLISNAKNKFGRSGLFEFFKSFVKLTIYSVCLALFLRARFDDIAASVHTSPSIAASYLARLCVEFLFLVLLVAIVIGGIDAVWQYHEHMRKNQMSRKEVMDETKDAEGDPHMKSERRYRAQTIAMNQMLADVPDADVIIVNPTHYAVALKWSRLPGQAPVCVAKGVDDIAVAIRKAAGEADVPIHHDPPTARALHATVEIGQQIAEDQYRAVAAAIQFAERMRLRARGRVL